MRFKSKKPLNLSKQEIKQLSSLLLLSYEQREPVSCEQQQTCGQRLPSLLLSSLPELSLLLASLQLLS